MIIYKKRVKESGDVEHCWYKSSNIFYTKVDFSKSENKILNEVGITLNVPTVDVTVVFNRGAQYLYKGVEIHDYVSFINVLNREDSSSHGKAHNKFIKHYPAQKLKNMDMDELQELKIKFLKQDEIERISKISFDEKVDECFNIMLNGNITDEELIEKYGNSVVEEALKKEKVWFWEINE